MKTCKWCGKVVIEDYDVWYCSRKCANEHYSHQAEEDRVRKAAWDVLTPEQKKAYEEQQSLELRRSVAEYQARKAEDKKLNRQTIIFLVTVAIVLAVVRKFLGYW